jgi:LysR family glycine cleavage system transcriptional activator
MARRIPPLNPLRVFEVVARTLNLTSAAQELHVTQSAVSRQIAALETYLGVELFRRERHGVALTRVGQSYAEQVIPAFEAIAGATDRLVRNTSQGALRVRTYTTFAAKWLIPRLPEFKQRHPNIDVKITNAVPDVDFDRDLVDVAIQYGNGRWPHLVADLLFQDEIEPVCSPRYLAQHLSARGKPQVLLRQRLLVSHYRRQDWDDWLTACRLVEEAAGAERMTFSSSVLTWQAALDGLGMAIGQKGLLLHELESGQLVRPFRKPLRRDQGHYLVRPQVQRESRKVSDFRNWLLESADTAAATAEML